MSQEVYLPLREYRGLASWPAQSRMASADDVDDGVMQYRDHSAIKPDALVV